MADSRGNIAQYTSPVDELRPNDTGAEALGQAGVHVGRLYNEAGSEIEKGADKLGNAVTDHDYMDELSQGSAAWSATFNSMTTQWNKMASQPGAAQDKSVQATFMNNNLEPALQDFQNGFDTEAGQKWGLEQANKMRDHFTEKTSSDMMTLSGEAKMQDATTTLNQIAGVVYKDPTSADAAYQHIHDTIDAIKANGTWDAEHIKEFDKMDFDMSNQVAKNQVQGFADQGNFKAASGLLASGALDGHLPGGEQAELHKYIDNAQKARQSDQDHAMLMQERAQKMKDDQFSNNVIASIAPDASGNINVPPGTMSKIFATQGISGKAKLETMEAVNKIAKGSVADDPATTRNNFTNLPNLSQADLRTQAAQGKITPETYKFFSEQVKETPEATAQKNMLANATSQVQKTILASPAPGLPPTDDQRQRETAFTNWFMPAYTEAMSDPANASIPPVQRSQMLLSSTDPKGLLTPDRMKQFVPSPQEVLSNGLKNVGPLPSGLSIPGAAPSAPTKDDLQSKASATKYNPTTKKYSYLVDSKWVDETGKEIK